MSRTHHRQRKLKSNYIFGKQFQFLAREWGDEIRFGRKKNRALSKVVRRRLKRMADDEIKSAVEEENGV